MPHAVNEIIEHPIAISGGVFYLSFFQQRGHGDPQRRCQLTYRVFRRGTFTSFQVADGLLRNTAAYGQLLLR